MVKWKNVLATSMLSAGLVFSSFAPTTFAKEKMAFKLKTSNTVQTNKDTKLPFLTQHTGGPFDMGLVNEEKVLKLLIKQKIVSKNATKKEQLKQMQAYFAKRSEKANELGLSQQEVKQLRTNLQKKAGLKIKPPKAPQTEKTINSNVSSQSSSKVVGPINKETWKGPIRTDKVLVLLIQYPDFPHNQITAQDDPVLLYKDYTQQHYKDMIFGKNGYPGPNGQNLISVKQFYEQQSGGSYTIDGQVSQWYTADHSAAYYGANNPVTQNDQHPGDLIAEALTKAAQDPAIHLNDYDKEDPYDLDSDGNYHEPDGIIDHLMVVHSGVGEEAGGGQLQGDAIWSHSSSILYEIPGTTNNVKYPDGSSPWHGMLLGLGYTVEPEDGAAGVFAHEFGHDLGLPDEYDTINSQNGVGAPTGFWTIMSDGAWGGKIAGTEPTGFSPYDKEFLQATMSGSNWFKDVEYSMNDLTNSKSIKLDEASVKGTNADSVKIKLPDKATQIAKPPSGQYAYFSGSGNSLDNAIGTEVDLTGKTSAQLTFKTWYSIEQDFDYAYVLVSDDFGQNFTRIAGNITTTANPNQQNLGNGITGDSNGWVTATFDLSAFAGKDILLGFEYITDPFVAGPGFYVDDIQVNADSQTVLSDNADDAASAFQLFGFEKNNGVKITSQYYLLEWRNYAAADQALAHISRGKSLMTYDPGLVVWYVDNKYEDNWVGNHPGDGFLGVVDAHQAAASWTDSNPNDGIDMSGAASTDYQIQDAAFSLSRTDSTFLDYKELYGTYLSFGSQPVATVFDDSRNYHNPGQIYAGRNVPNYGLKIHVVDQASDMSVGSIELHKGSIGSLQVNSLSKSLYSNQKGFNQLTVSGKVHHDGTGESQNMKYEILNSKGTVISTTSETLTGIDKSFTRMLTLPVKTPTGTYTVKVTAAGISTTKQLTFKVDNDPPTVTVDRNGSTTPAKSAAVKVTLKDANAKTPEYVWSQTASAPRTGWKSFTSGSALKLLGKNGKWYLHVREKDSVGNSVNWNSKSFLLDNTAPGKPHVDTVVSKLKKVTGHTEKGAKITVKAGSKIVGTATAGKDGAYSVKLNKALKVGTVISVTATDTAGNTSGATKAEVKKK